MCSTHQGSQPPSLLSDTPPHPIPQLEDLIERNYYLNKSAREAYRSYLQAYASHSLKDVFDVSVIELQRTARAFGFNAPPKVHLSTSICCDGLVRLFVCMGSGCNTD